MFESTQPQQLVRREIARLGFSDAGLALAQAEDAAAQRTALGLGDSAVEDVDDLASLTDPWTYVALGSDFTTDSNSAVDVTGLTFTPAANTRYEFEGFLEVRTADAAVGPRVGIAWPTGGSAGVGTIRQTTTLTAEAIANGNIAGALLIAAGTVPLAATSYPAKANGFFSAGASPSGGVKLQLASSLAGTVVTVKAGSFLRYRSF